MTKKPSEWKSYRHVDLWMYRPRGVIFVEPLYDRIDKLIGLKSKNILHLFSGKSKIGLTCDINPFNNPKKVMDCTRPFDFKDEEFDVVLADPPYYQGHGYGVKPYSFVKEAVRVLKTGGYLVILHTLQYITPKGCERFGLIGISTGPNLKARFLNVFRKVEHIEQKDVKSDESMRRMV